MHPNFMAHQIREARLEHHVVVAKVRANRATRTVRNFIGFSKRDTGLGTNAVPGDNEFGLIAVDAVPHTRELQAVQGV